VIELSTLTPLGTGLERACYAHPEDETRCIKVSIAPPSQGRREQSPQDARYLSHLARRGVPFQHFMRYHGKVETNMGTGYVFDRCVNVDGSMPKSLRQLMHEDASGWPRNLVAELREAMLRHGVVPCDLMTDNILFPMTEHGHIAVLVDGVGNRDFIPLATYSRAYARMKIRRKWEKFLVKKLGITSAELRPRAPQ